MSRELRRVLIWLTALVLSFGAAKATGSAGLGDVAIVRAAVIGIAVFSASKLIYALFDLGGSRHPDRHLGLMILRMNVGCRWAFLVIGILMLAAVAWTLAQGLNSDLAAVLAAVFMYGFVAILSIYMIALAIRYAIVYDDNVVWDRGRLLIRWRCNLWENLQSIDSDGFELQLFFLGGDRVDVSIWTYGLTDLMKHARAVLDSNKANMER